MRCNAKWTKREAGDRGEVVEWSGIAGEGEREEGDKEKEKRGERK
jgi:hypothetical protein